MSEENQKATAEIVKHAAEHDLLSICVAQVRHKNDLVIRMNPDLTGRLTNIDFDLWSREDIAKIAHGFQLLNIEVSNSIVDAFATESGGSPQIMQSICLSACIKNKSLTVSKEKIQFHAKNIDISTVISSCIEAIDRDRLVTRLEAGPPTHGTDRLSFEMIDGTTLDVYGCILAAIALNPPWLEIKKSQLIDRVGFLTKSDSPNTSSILRSLTHMQAIAQKYDNFNDYIEWDDDKGLQILDPYLLFYIRWIMKFRSIRELYELNLSKKNAI
ncbi:hypothetical protein [Aquitalea sp.]|uniref:hypothetical protein n=1 Tax=Aquitalea sp. TaxID=1872623 RepID=UPI002590AB21|nr:hypothetical protein [Aquitalea sp.]